MSLLRPPPLPLPWTPHPGVRPRSGASSPGSIRERVSSLSAPSLLLPDLEQRILQVLRDAGSPVKSVQLAKECQVPKKNLNQVLYRMLKESKVSLEGPATWGLGQGGTREVEPAEPAQPSQGNLPTRRERGGGPCTGSPGSGHAGFGPGFEYGLPKYGFCLSRVRGIPWPGLVDLGWRGGEGLTPTPSRRSAEHEQEESHGRRPRGDGSRTDLASSGVPALALGRRSPACARGDDPLPLGPEA